MMAKFHQLPLITIAVIDGIGAMGGASELVTACDYRLMTPNAKIAFLQVKPFTAVNRLRCGNAKVFLYRPRWA